VAWDYYSTRDSVKLLFQAVLLLVASGCGDDADVSFDGGLPTVDASPEIDAGPKGDRWFLESAKILALREQPGLYLDEERARVIDGLIARAKQVDIDAEGIVFENIFARPPYTMDQINLWSSDPAMYGAWERGVIETGNKELDALLQSLAPTKVEPVTSYLVELWFARWVDIDELIARLEDFSFLDAYSVCHCMDGDDIELVEEENQARLTFHLRWDDCFSGCLKDHWWEIVVPHDADLPAELVDEGGTPLPPP
jgi:hypothetical protein